jgi:hypothetical protein
MAVNDSRSMNEDFEQGSIDSTYIQLAPDRGGVIEVMPLERLQWPTYAQAERHDESPFFEAHVRKSMHPHEVMTTYGGEQRY